ncbi:MAG: D-alanine--D-alanine ligase [Actinomycetes bacterium]
MKVALLEGGRSLERGVSLRTSARVRDALVRLGHEPIGVDADGDLVPTLRDLAPDAAFIALHGGDGEDGMVQELLELLGIPYTGSGPEACAQTSDKSLAKSLLRAAGLPTPESATLDGEAMRELGAAQALPEIGQKLGWPMVVKPVSLGSALGLGLAHNADEAPAAMLKALSYDDRVLLERFVAGRDLAVAVIGEAAGPRALPAVEAVPVGDSYDFEARYEIGATNFVCPAEIPEETADEAARIAVEAFEVFGCRGVARVDLLLGEDGSLTVLELDTIPGLTQTSLVPLAAEAAGIGFDDLIETMLDLSSPRA